MAITRTTVVRTDSVPLRYRSKRPVTFIVLGLITLFMAFPLIWLLLMTFQTNQEILNNPISLPSKLSFENYMTAFKTVNFPLLFGNTFIFAIVSVVVATAISVLSSYAIARLRFRFKKLLYLFFLSGLAIPVFILLVPIFTLTNLFGIQGTYVALILPYIASQISIDTLILVGFLKSFPKELEDAAVIDGCGIFRVLLKVVIPLMKPALATTIIFNFLGIWNEYPIASILINRPSMETISLTAYKFIGQYTTNYAGMSAAILIMIIPEVILFVVFQRQIVAGLTAGAVKG